MVLAHVDVFLRGFRDHYLFAGVAAYAKAGRLVWNAAYPATYAVAANDIAANDIFPLGTGALSYIAAAAFQLRDANILDLDQPLTNYLDPADFGFASQWCPSIYAQPHEESPTGSTAASPSGVICTTPSIRQVLGMTAGLVDVADCNYTAGAWQTQYCAFNQPTYAALVQEATQGNVSAAQLISAFLWQAPLEFAPDEAFSFSPAGYWLVVYVIEQVTGGTLAEYLEDHIFQAVNLTSTFSGTPFSPGPGSISDLAVAVPGFVSAFTANVTVAPAHLPQGTYANTTQLLSKGSEVLLAVGLGSIWASAADHVSWYQSLLGNSSALSLAPTTITEMLTPSPLALVAENFYFAQGIGVVPTAGSSLYVDAVAFTGRFAGVKTSLPEKGV
ncbi:hypothetical protein WJX84_003956 [Apatococcus fuscideae]|uniref:Beta-lactamase-related domain-containing protein n=1 Tax=Apatococcus fuscideae TaxID=2026836 RepID=A0AAW1SZQ8_9CHLO